MAHPSLSASDGLSWIAQAVRTLGAFWPLWLAWWVCFLVVIVGLGILNAILVDPIPVVGGLVGGLLMMVASIGLHVGAWALALDRLGHRPFQWAHVRSVTLRLTGLGLLIVGLLAVLAAVVFFVGLQFNPSRDDVIVAGVIALLPVLLVAMVVGALLMFTTPCLLDDTDGPLSMIGAMRASSRLVRRQWRPILVAGLLALAGMMGLATLLAVPLWILAPKAGPLVNAVLQPLFYVVDIVLFSVGYVRLRTFERTALENSPAPSTTEP